MDIYEIEKIINRVSLHLDETNTNLPFNLPTAYEIKRAFDNQEENEIILNKFHIINKLYELITK